MTKRKSASKRMSKSARHNVAAIVPMEEVVTRLTGRSIETSVISPAVQRLLFTHYHAFVFERLVAPLQQAERDFCLLDELIEGGMTMTGEDVWDAAEHVRFALKELSRAVSALTYEKQIFTDEDFVARVRSITPAKAREEGWSLPVV